MPGAYVEEGVYEFTIRVSPGRAVNPLIEGLQRTHEFTFRTSLQLAEVSQAMNMAAATLGGPPLVGPQSVSSTAGPKLIAYPTLPEDLPLTRPSDRILHTPTTVQGIGRASGQIVTIEDPFVSEV